MDNPFFIGVDMASGPDETVFSKPMAKEPTSPNRLSVIRISFFVLCQGCLRLSIYLWRNTASKSSANAAASGAAVKTATNKRSCCFAASEIKTSWACKFLSPAGHR